jgi:hypothetical protein
MRCRSSSPFSVTYLSWHLVPTGGPPQFSAISEKPMSLPPTPRVTRPVLRVRASNWGGFGPGLTPWGWVMSSVSAPLQLTSLKIGRPVWGATMLG